MGSTPSKIRTGDTLGYPTPHPGLDGDTPLLKLDGGTAPPPRQETDQHSEDLLRGGQYASCIHAGGLSCFSFYFAITDPIGIRCYHVMSYVQVDNSKILICGKYEKVTNAWSELIEYSLEDGRLLNRTTLRGEPYGITEVMLRGEWCLAVTYQ